MGFLNTPRQTAPRRWMFLAHLWLGLVVGPIVGVVGLTGAVVVFRYEINRLTTPGTAYVTPAGTRLPMDTIVDRMRAARPGDTLEQVSWGEVGPDNAWNIRSRSPDGHRIHTYVNQYTGAITGIDNYDGAWMQWFYELHAHLLAGDTGKVINGFVGLATVALSVTGLVVWWPGLPRWAFGFRYLWGAGWKRQTYDLHKLTGFYASVAMAVVAFTGAYFAFPDVYAWAATRLTGTPVTIGAPRAATAWPARRVTLETFIQAAREAQPGAHVVSLTLPRTAGEPVTVRTKEEKDWHRIGLNYVYLEPADATLIRSDRFSEVTLGTQALLFVYPLHFGRFGGRLNRTTFYGVMVAYVCLGVAPVVLMMSGLVMYWNRSWSATWRRRRTGRGPSLHPLPPRSTRAAGPTPTAPGTPPSVFRWRS